MASKLEERIAVASARVARAQQATAKAEAELGEDQERLVPTTALIAARRATAAAVAAVAAAQKWQQVPEPAELAVESAIEASEAALAACATISAHATERSTTGPSMARAKLSVEGGCSFCGKTLAEGIRVAHGPGVRICNECVVRCGVLLQVEHPST